jgi:hypothetical protein
LAKLDPRRVVEELAALCPNPTILCWEKVKDIEQEPTTAIANWQPKWLEDMIGMKVEEVGHPDLSRFRYLRGQHVKSPTYDKRPPQDLLDLLDEVMARHLTTVPSLSTG